MEGSSGNTLRYCELDGRLQPELGFSFRREDVNVLPRLLPGEEEKAEWTLSEDCRTHRVSILQTTDR